MKIFGYQKSNDDLLKLNEMSIQCDLDELEKIINFLKTVKKEHASVVGKIDMCHSHFRDWDKTWRKGEPDIIIVTNLEE